GMQFARRCSERERAGDGLGDSSGGDGISGCLMRAIESHLIVLSDDLERALSLAVAVDCFVDDEWVDNRSWRFERRDAVTQAFVCQKRKIVRGVVCDNGDALCE